MLTDLDSIYRHQKVLVPYEQWQMGRMIGLVEKELDNTEIDARLTQWKNMYKAHGGPNVHPSIGREADREAARGNAVRAYDLLEEALALASEDGDARNILQDLEDLCGDHETLLQRGLEVAPDLEKLNLRMGDRLHAAFVAAEAADFLERLGKGREAEKEYVRALAEYSESTWLRVRYARFLSDRGNRCWRCEGHSPCR